jgi:hypothetical protein
MCDSSPELGHNASAFVAGNKWRSWLDGPVAFRGVQVGMTHTGGDYLHKCLTWAWSGYWDFLNDEGLAEFLDDRCLHGFGNSHD